MPLKYFICPDNVRLDKDDCLKESGCRLGNRCATRSYLRLVAKDRKWTGKASTTQLIQGTMQAFLKLTKDYAVSPDMRAFMINGTKGHNNLEESPDEFSMLEEKFTDGDISGIADVIETEGNRTILADYKTSGSYKVAKALGITIVKEPTGEVYKSGKRVGEPKMRNIMKQDDNAIDRWEWELQLNKYRIEFERKYKKKIDEIRMQCIVRDGNTYIARSRGVIRNVYYFKLPIKPDKEILSYFDIKKKALLQSLKQGYWHDICDAFENWDGLKCSKYCEVAEFCKFGKYLKREKEGLDMVIKGLSDVRRLPRLGKIRLGIKKKTAAGKEYPAEVDYFILAPQTPSEEENEKLQQEFAKLYGEKPKQIQIMFPVADPKIFFAQFYKRYGSGTMLQCKGDGEIATCGSDEFAKDLEVIKKDEMGLPVVKCMGKQCGYYEANKCSEVGALQVLLPELPGAGVWQVSTGSFHSIVNINSCIDYIRAIAGRVHMIPLLLERREQEIAHEGKKRMHYILHINMNFKLADLQKQALIDPSKILLELPSADVVKEDLEVVPYPVGDVQDAETSPKTEPKPVDDTMSPTPSEKESVSPSKPGKEAFKALTEKDIVVKIKELLKKAGFIGKKNAEGVLYEIKLIQTKKKDAQKYSELTKNQLIDLAYDLQQADGDVDKLTIPFGDESGGGEEFK